MHNNRIKNNKFWKNDQSPREINRYFLACEFKPNSSLWGAIEPFAYDVAPAYIHGQLGIVSYSPPSYSIVCADKQDEPLIGYIMTITNPDGVLLLDKIKGFWGEESFNCHVRVLQNVYTDTTEVSTAWCYMLSQYVINAYQQIEQVQFGLWADNDQQQIGLLEKIGVL